MHGIPCPMAHERVVQCKVLYCADFRNYDCRPVGGHIQM